MSYGITLCYLPLPPDRDYISAHFPAEAGTRFSDHGVDLVGWLFTEMLHPLKTITHPSNNRVRTTLSTTLRQPTVIAGKRATHQGTAPDQGEV